MATTPTEPYGFSIAYQESIENIYTLLTGRKRVPKTDPEGRPIPGQWDEVTLPNAYPLLTPEAGSRVRNILEISMDKFNPIAKLKDIDCAVAAAEVERALGATITLNANDYLYDYENRAVVALTTWDSYLKSLTQSLYRFATLARDGHFINFAKAIMTYNPTSPPMPAPEGKLRRLFQRPKRQMVSNDDSPVF